MIYLINSKRILSTEAWEQRHTQSIEEFCEKVDIKK